MMKSIESWENSFQLNRRGHLSKLEKFQDNSETPPECPNRSKRAEATRNTKSWLQNPDVGGHLES